MVQLDLVFIDGKIHSIEQYDTELVLRVERDIVYSTNQRTSKVQKFTNRKPDRGFLKRYLYLTADWL